MMNIKKNIVGLTKIKKELINNMWRTETKTKKNSNDIESFTDKYEFLSNEFPCDIEYKGIHFNSAAVLFYALKCDNLRSMKKFSKLNPGNARKKLYTIPYNEEYEDNKEEILKKVVKLKFDSNDYLRKKLVETYPKKLINTVTYPDTWLGVRYGEGQNYLGEVLMDLRQTYKNSK